MTSHDITCLPGQNIVHLVENYHKLVRVKNTSSCPTYNVLLILSYITLLTTVTRTSRSYKTVARGPGEDRGPGEERKREALIDEREKGPQRWEMESLCSTFTGAGKEGNGTLTVYGWLGRGVGAHVPWDLILVMIATCDVGLGGTAVNSRQVLH